MEDFLVDLMAGAFFCWGALVVTWHGSLSEVR